MAFRRTLVVPLLALIGTVSASLLTAQTRDITGTWQGWLQAPEGARREVIKIAAEGTSLSAVLYSIDQGTGPFAGAVTLQDTGVSMSFPSISATYAARLTADGTAIEGNWSRNGQTIPLTVKHVTAQETWAIPPSAEPKPMAADADPAFEAATIKPSTPGAPGGGIQVHGRQLTMVNTTVGTMIAFSYRLHTRQIVGAPPWINRDLYDVVARPDGEGQPGDRQWRVMIQKFIADRFRLTFHHDARELPMYAIVVGKRGATLTKSAAPPTALPAMGLRGPGSLVATNATMNDFAQYLDFVLDRPVVDQTGLAGRFDFTLMASPPDIDGRAGAPLNDPNAPPSIFTAVQEQLGLRLESTKARVDVIVIDHVERPSAD